MSSYAFDGEEDWLEGAIRALKGFLNEVLNVGTASYEIITGFPPDEIFGDRRMPLENVLIHVDIDDINNPIFGFGDTVLLNESQYDFPTANEMTPVEAQQHVINYDIGIWATEKAGGDTARLRVYQRLTHSLSGTEAYKIFATKTGTQIRNFYGGHFIVDTINDIKVWRVANVTLSVVLFNKRYASPVPYIQTITSDGAIHIDDTVIVDE